MNADYGILETEKLLNLEVKSKNSKNSKESKESIIYGRGGILPKLKFVYFPIGDFYYLYNLNGLKGLSKAVLNPEKSKGKNKEYILEIEDFIFTFKDKPLPSDILPEIPADLIQDWIEGKTPQLTGKEIFHKIYNYFKLTIDLEEEHHYLNPTLLVLQSWIEDFLEVVFYVGFEAKYGSGKTKALEVTSALLRRGFLVGDISSAGIGRISGNYGLNICTDELDTAGGTKDNIIYKLYRQGYRRGNPYVRVNENDYSKIDSFDGFGSKAFTIAEDIERALKQRSLMTPMRPSKDKRLPVNNMYIRHYGKEIRTSLLLWYLDSIVDILPIFTTLPFLPHISEGMNISESRDKLYNAILKGFSDSEKLFLEKWAGRNLELAFNIPMIQKAFKINILKEVENVFLEKDDDDANASETTQNDIMKECLVTAYNNYKDRNKLEKGDFKDCFYYPKYDMFNNVRTILKDRGHYPVGNDKFMRALKEFNFRKGIKTGNVKRQQYHDDTGKRNVLCLIYDSSVLQALDIPEETKV